MSPQRSPFLAKALALGSGNQNLQKVIPLILSLIPFFFFYGFVCKRVKKCEQGAFSSLNELRWYETAEPSQHRPLNSYTPTIDRLIRVNGRTIIEALVVIFF